MTRRLQWEPPAKCGLRERGDEQAGAAQRAVPGGLAERRTEEKPPRGTRKLRFTGHQSGRESPRTSSAETRTCTSEVNKSQEAVMRAFPMK